MTQSSRNQPAAEQTILAKWRPSMWNGSPTFNTWAHLANKWRKSIATSSLALLILSFYFKKGEPIPTAAINRTFARNETQVFM